MVQQAAQRGDAAGATRLARRVAQDHTDPGVLTELGQVFQRICHDFEEAERYYRPAAEQGSALAMAELGVIFAERRSYQEATGWLRRAVAAEATEYAMVHLSHALMSLGEYEEARRWLRRAADENELHTDHLLDIFEELVDEDVDGQQRAPQPSTPCHPEARFDDWVRRAQVLVDSYADLPKNSKRATRDPATRLIAEYAALHEDGQGQPSIKAEMAAILLCRIAALEAARSGDHDEAAEFAEAPAHQWPITADLSVPMADLAVDIGDVLACTDHYETALRLLKVGRLLLEGTESAWADQIASLACHATVEAMLYEVETASDPVTLDIHEAMALAGQAITFREALLDPADQDSVTALAESYLLDSHLRILNCYVCPNPVAVAHLAASWTLIEQAGAAAEKWLRATAVDLARILNRTSPDAVRTVTAMGRWPTHRSPRKSRSLPRWTT
jgi:tetratricopeptide (TPR) repeat protein